LALDFLNNGEASTNRCEGFGIVFPDLFDGVLGGDDKFTGTDVAGTALDFSDKRKKVSPVFNLGGEISMVDIHVIEDDDFFVLVAIPPFVEGLEVGGRVGAVDRRCLTASGLSVNPDAAGGLELSRADHVVFGDLFDSIVMSEPEFCINGIKVSSLSGKPREDIPIGFGLTDFLRRLGAGAEFDKLSSFGAVDDIFGRCSF